MAHRGGAFHLGQTVWCSVQAVGLQSAYTADEEINRICRKTLALTFLPADVIPAAFLALEGANTDGLVDQHRPTCGWSQLFGHHQRGQSTASLSELTVIAKAGIITSTLKPAQSAEPVPDDSLQLLHDEASLVCINVRLLSEGSASKIQRASIQQAAQSPGKVLGRETDDNRSVSRILSTCTRASKNI